MNKTGINKSSHNKASLPNLNDQELERYSRQILLPQFDIAGQLALKKSRALIIGLGGLGSPVAMYLAAAGVGELCLVDDDVVDSSNLQRQIIHQESSIGESKVTSAARHIQALNSQCAVTTLAQKIEGAALENAVAAADVILDCTDNFTTRMAINAASVRHKKPLVSGAAIRFEGQLAVFDPRDPEAPCYQCLYATLGEVGLSCSESGVLSPVVGVIGSSQAVEAIKVLAGIGQPLKGRVQFYDGLAAQWRTFGLKKDLSCGVCGGEI